MPLHSLDEVASGLGEHENTFRSFMRDCHKAGYDRIIFNRYDRHAKMFEHWGNYHGSVFSSPLRYSTHGFPTLWRICERYGVGDGAGNDQQHNLKKEFSRAVGALSFFWNKKEWYTSYVYSPKEYRELHTIWHSLELKAWPWDGRDYLYDEGMKSLAKRPSHKVKPSMWSDMNTSLLPAKEVNALMHMLFSYPLHRMPLYVNDYLLKPIAVWRLKLGR